MNERPRPIRLALELDAGDEVMAGSLYDEHGTQHGFESWLRLLTLLEGARARAAGGSHSDAARPGTPLGSM